jgi:hypothetical protein
MALLAGEERGQVEFVQPVEGVEEATAETLAVYRVSIFVNTALTRFYTRILGIVVLHVMVP